MQGTPVGSYVISGLIGEGGMGVVYAANHALLGRPAAIKVLLPEFSRNQDIVNRFFNEARAATAIRHPGIVEIYDFGYLGDGSAYIAMELLEGQSLAARLAERRVTAHEALYLVRQIAGALGAAHARGIVHRDLKPDNVFLVRDPEMPTGERIKLLDFGIAKLAGDGPQSQRTRTGAVMGTPTYMAPEQCRGVTVDHRADLYSLGCILFEMVCSGPPFVGEGVGDVLAAHIHVPPPSPRSRNAQLPAELDAFIVKLLAKDPAQRPQTSEQVIGLIDALGPVAARPATSPVISAPSHTYTTGAPTTLSGAASAIAQQTQPPPAAKSRGPLFAGIGAVVVAAGVAIAVLAGGGGGGDAKQAAEPQAKIEEQEPEPKPEPKPEPEPEPPPPPEIKKVILDIDSVPRGARVIAGDEELGVTPMKIERDKREGTRHLVLRLDGYKDSTLDLAAGVDARETVKLTRIKKATKPPKKKTGRTGESNRNESVNPFDY